MRRKVTNISSATRAASPLPYWCRSSQRASPNGSSCDEIRRLLRSVVLPHVDFKDLSLLAPDVHSLTWRDLKLRKRTVKAAHPVPDGEMFTLSVRRQEYLMKLIFYRLRYSAVDRTLIRQGSVLGFSVVS